MGGVSKVGSGPGPNRWLNRWLSVTIASIEKGRLYSSCLFGREVQVSFFF